MKENREKHGVPAILSFFLPGLGQLVKGHIGKGIITFIVFLISCILVFFIIGFITTPIIYVWNIYDAYNSNSSSLGI